MTNESILDKNLQLEHVFFNLPCGVWWMDRNHSYLGCNRLTLRVVKLTPEKFLGKSVLELADKYNWLQSVAHEIYEMDERIMQTKTTEFQILHVMPQGSSEQPLRQLCAKAPILNARGEVLGLIGAGVLERELDNQFELPNNKLVEDQFIVQNHPTINFGFREIFQMAPCGFFWMGKDHRYLGCNKETLRVLNLQSPYDMIGKTIYDIGLNKSWPQFKAKNIFDLDQLIMYTGFPEYRIQNIMPQGYKIPSIRQIVAKKAIFAENTDQVIGLMGAAIYDGRFGEPSLA